MFDGLYNSLYTRLWGDTTPDTTPPDESESSQEEKQALTSPPSTITMAQTTAEALQSAADWNRQGEAYYQQGDYVQAANCFEQAVVLEPTNKAYRANQKLASLKQKVASLEQEKALEEQKIEGARLHELGRYTESHAVWNKMLAQDNDDAWVWNQQGFAYDAEGKHDEALPCYAQAVALEPTDKDYLANQGDTLRQLGRYAEAHTAFEQVLAQDEGYARAWNQQGLTYDAEGKYDEALPCFERAVALEPTDKVYLENQKALRRQELEQKIALQEQEIALQKQKIEGARLHELGRYAEAHVALEKALAQGNDDAWVWNLQGLVYDAESKHEDALPCFARAVALEPTDKAYLANQGITLRQLGRYSEAHAALEAALAQDEQYARAWNQQGVVYDAEGKDDEALRCVARAVALAPTDKAYRANQKLTLRKQGKKLRQLGHYTEAHAVWNKMLAQDNDDAWVWNQQGMTYAAEDKCEDALPCFERAVALEPTNKLYLENQEYNQWEVSWEQRVASLKQGKKLHQLGHYTESHAVWNKMLAQDNDDAGVWNQHGMTYYAEGKYEEALRCFAQAVALTPTHKVYLANQGESLRQLGRYTEAHAVWDKMLAQNESYARAWNQQGLTYDAEGKHDEALPCYERAVALEPMNKVYLENQGKKLRQLGHYTESHAVWNKVLAQDKKNAWVWNVQGMTYAAEGNFNEALRCYEIAAACKPTRTLYRVNQGDTLRQLGRYTEAHMVLVTALDRNKGDTTVLYQQSRVYMAQGHVNNALASIAKALASSRHPFYLAWQAYYLTHVPDYGQATQVVAAMSDEAFAKTKKKEAQEAATMTPYLSHYLQGVCATALGQDDAAHAHYQQVIEQFASLLPGYQHDYDYQWMRYTALVSLQDLQTADEYYRELVKQHPAHQSELLTLLTDGWMTHGVALYEQANLDAALPYFERVLYLDATQSTAMQYVSRCLQRQHLPAQAQLTRLHTYIAAWSSPTTENKSESELAELPVAMSPDMFDVLQTQVLHAVEASLLAHDTIRVAETDSTRGDTVADSVVEDVAVALSATDNHLLDNVLARAQALWGEEKHAESDRVDSLEQDTQALADTLSTAISTLTQLQQRMAAHDSRADELQSTLEVLAQEQAILQAEAQCRIIIRTREAKVQGCGYPVLWVFYQQVQRKLTSILLTYTVLDSHLVKADISGWQEKAHGALGHIVSGLDTLESLNPEPISKCIMAAGLYGFERFTTGSRTTKIDRVTDSIHTVAGVDTTVAETVCLLVQRYASQLAYLTEASVRQVAEYAIEWIQSVLVTIQADTLQGKTLARMLVDSFINCDIKRGMMGRKHRDLDTINDVVNRTSRLRWKEGNLFRKPGVCRYVAGQAMRYYSYNPGWPIHPKCDAYKYGYCLGTDELLNHLQYQEDVGQGLQPKAKKQTLTTSPFIPPPLLLDLMD